MWRDVLSLPAVFLAGERFRGDENPKGSFGQRMAESRERVGSTGSKQSSPLRFAQCGLHSQETLTASPTLMDDEGLAGAQTDGCSSWQGPMNETPNGFGVQNSRSFSTSCGAWEREKDSRVFVRIPPTPLHRRGENGCRQCKKKTSRHERFVRSDPCRYEMTRFLCLSFRDSAKRRREILNVAA